jgi:transcriptional regulator with XRE-family HTH domain
MKKTFECNAKEVAERLRALRLARHLTMEDVARATQISFSTISKVETGKGSLGYATIVKLADYYGVTKESILEGDRGDMNGSISVVGSPKAVAVVNGIHAHGPDVITQVSRIMAEKENMDKAIAVATTLHCNLADAIEIVVRQSLKSL